LQSFVAAYRERHWEAMLEMVPQRYCEHLTAAQIEGSSGRRAPGTMDDLAGSLDGDRERAQARLRYGDGRGDAHREGGRWKVKDSATAPSAAGAVGRFPRRRICYTSAMKRAVESACRDRGELERGGRRPTVVSHAAIRRTDWLSADPADIRVVRSADMAGGAGFLPMGQYWRPPGADGRRHAVCVLPSMRRQLPARR
jgi:hypothetical protein